MDNVLQRKPIVVGYDASPAANGALRWALGESKLRGVPIVVAHIVEWPVTAIPGEIGVLAPELRHAVEAEMRQAVAENGGSAAEVRVLEGSIVGLLCTLSDQAELVVVGARGSGGFGGLLIGSVGLSVAVHAACPVIVVRETGDEQREGLPIVVGVDDSMQAQLAIRFAFAQAAARGCDLVAVRAWSHGHGERDPEELESAERHRVRELLQPARQEFATVPASIRLVLDSPGKALVEASQQAQLVVVGSRGRGGFKGLLLGSVSQQVLHHAHCPVAVVR